MSSAEVTSFSRDTHTFSSSRPPSCPGDVAGDVVLVGDSSRKPQVGEFEGELERARRLRVSCCTRSEVLTDPTGSGELDTRRILVKSEGAECGEEGE